MSDKGLYFNMRSLRSALRLLSPHRFGDLPYLLMALALPFAAYLHTLAPSVADIFSDSLEMQLVAYRLGIAHPTGYPLYTLLGKAFTLLPIGNVAYRVNLLSAFFGALTIMMTFLAARCLGAGRLASLAAALALAFSPTFWSQAVIAEVYTLNAFFLAGMLWLTLRAPQGSERASPQTAGRFLYPIAFFYGLSLTHHRTMLLLGPALMVYLWFWRKTLLVPEGWAGRVGRCLAFFALPLLLYLYIPIRGMVTTSLDGTYRNTLPGFLSWIMGSSYAVFLKSNPLQQEPRSGEWLAHLFLDQFTAVGVGVGIIGFLWLLRRQLPRAIFLGLALLGYTAFGFYYRVSDIEVFFIPAYVIFAPIMGYGFSVLRELPAKLWLPRIGLRREGAGGAQGVFAASLLSVLADGLRWLVAAALLLVVLGLPAYLLKDNLPRQDMSRNWTAHEYGQRVLQQPLEQGAVIVGILGEMTLLRYFQETEGIRTDLITIAADEEGERLKAVSQALQAGKAVYLTRPLHGVEDSYALASFGPLIKVLPAPLTQVPTIQTPRSVNFGGEIALLGYALEERPRSLQPASRAAPSRRGRSLEREGEGVEAGKHLGVTLYWQAIKKPSQDYKVSLRLVSAAGRLVAQRDGTPVADAYRTGAWRQGEVVIDTHYIHVPLGTIPGEYRLHLVLYSEAMPHGVPAYDGRDTRSLVDLGPVRVSRPLNPPSLDALPARLDRPANRPSLPSWTEGDSLASLGVQFVLRGNFDNQVSLFGYGLSRDPLKPGEWVDIVLLWQAQREMSDDHVAHIRLVDAHGRIWAASDQMPGGDGNYPTSRWLRGEIVRDVHPLRLPADTPDGRYLLQLSLYTPPRNEPVTVLYWTRRSGDTLDLGTVTVKGREHRFDMPPIPRLQTARLGDSVRLLGYGLEREGSTIKLTIYWQALARVERSYTVFTHLVDGNNRIWAQHDGLPQDGAAPTPGWLPGEVLADKHTLVLKPGAPAGEYQLVIGLYDAASGQRLPVFDAANNPVGDYILLMDRVSLP